MITPVGCTEAKYLGTYPNRFAPTTHKDLNPASFCAAKPIHFVWVVRLGVHLLPPSLNSHQDASQPFYSSQGHPPGALVCLWGPSQAMWMPRSAVDGGGTYNLAS